MKIRDNAFDQWIYCDPLISFTQLPIRWVYEKKKKISKCLKIWNATYNCHSGMVLSIKVPFTSVQKKWFPYSCKHLKVCQKGKTHFIKSLDIIMLKIISSPAICLINKFIWRSPRKLDNFCTKLNVPMPLLKSWIDSLLVIKWLILLHCLNCLSNNFRNCVFEILINWKNWHCSRKCIKWWRECPCSLGYCTAMDWCSIHIIKESNNHFTIVHF